MHRFRQVLLASCRDDTQPLGWRVQLEILKVRQKGPRRNHTIRADGAVILAGRGGCGGSDACPTGVALDWLQDHPEAVEGLKPADVLAAIAAVRIEGGWFVIPKHTKK